jgi:hypothetical protein
LLAQAQALERSWRQLKVQTGTLSANVKKEAYDNGSEDISVKTLMDIALTKFNQLKQAKMWKAKSHEQEQVFALIAKLKQAQSKFIAKPNEQKCVEEKTSENASTQRGTMC